ncbi:MAG: DegQ family serine endoprotease [Planctomycetaceae bacterium]|nr:DegQ family serine endoprotease [Planctomycetaceae bacterium]
MKREKTLLVFLSILTISILSPLCQAAPDKKADIETLRNTGEAFADIAEKVSPAVVFISTEQTYTQKLQYFNPFEDDEFFQRFFGPQMRQRQQPQQQQPKERKQVRRGQGSGFIISADGYILTNNHVVKDANTITVKLSDDRELKAKVVGTDPETDIAVIKVDAKDLPFAELGDSDKLRVGQWVLAIGNPFGLSHTVTSGIVSAKGRTNLGLPDVQFQDFIQTDAAINFGNSGGPLINIDGKVVGINSAIYSSSGGYMGIGFAVPINIAKYVYEQIAKDGKVTRGYIGIFGKDVTPEMAELLGAKDVKKGVLVDSLVKDSPAEKAELQKGDIIIKKDGREIETWDGFRNEVAKLAPGTKLKLAVIRDGKEKEFTIELAARPGKEIAKEEAQEASEKLGITVQNLTDELAQKFDYKGETGVIVTEVGEGSPAEESQIVAGTLIIEVNRQKVKDVDEFWAAVKKGGNSLLFYVRQGDVSRYIVVKLDE